MHYCTRIRCDEFLRKRDIEKYFIRRDDPTLSISPSENIGGVSENEIDNSALLTEKAALNNFVEKEALVVITRSEYNNLTNEEKNKDIFYFIKE